MKYEQAKAYLNRYKEKMKQLSILADEIATIRSKVGNATGSGLILNDAGKSSVHIVSDPLFELSMKLQDYEKENRILLKETSRLERELTLLIIKVLPESKYYYEQQILLSIYLYLHPISKVKQELNILSKTFEYHQERGYQLISSYLIENGLIIPLEMKAPHERLIEKILS